MFRLPPSPGAHIKLFVSPVDSERKFLVLGHRPVAVKGQYPFVGLRLVIQFK